MATRASTSRESADEESVECDQRLAEVLQLQQMQQKQEVMQLQQTHLVTNADTEFRRGLEELVRDHLQTCMAIASSSYSEAHSAGTESLGDGPEDVRLVQDRQPRFSEGGVDGDREELEEEGGARLVRRRRTNRQGPRGFVGRPSRRDPSLLQRLETWHARQAEEMMTTMERQAREAELLALAGLHAVSMLDASFLQERASSPQAAPDLPRQRRGQAWSLVQRWRELEIEQAAQQREQSQQEDRVRARGPELGLDQQEEHLRVVQRPRRESNTSSGSEPSVEPVNIARQEGNSQSARPGEQSEHALVGSRPHNYRDTADVNSSSNSLIARHRISIIEGTSDTNQQPLHAQARVLEMRDSLNTLTATSLNTLTPTSFDDNNDITGGRHVGSQMTNRPQQQQLPAQSTVQTVNTIANERSDEARMARQLELQPLLDQATALAQAQENGIVDRDDSHRFEGTTHGRDDEIEVSSHRPVEPPDVDATLQREDDEVLTHRLTFVPSDDEDSRGNRHSETEVRLPGQVLGNDDGILSSVPSTAAVSSSSSDGGTDHISQFSRLFRERVAAQAEANQEGGTANRNFDDSAPLSSQAYPANPSSAERTTETAAQMGAVQEDSQGRVEATQMASASPEVIDMEQTSPSEREALSNAASRVEGVQNTLAIVDTVFSGTSSRSERQSPEGRMHQMLPPGTQTPGDDRRVSTSVVRGGPVRQPQIAIVEEQRLHERRPSGSARPYPVAQRELPAPHPGGAAGGSMGQLEQIDREELREELSGLWASRAVSAFAHRQHLQSFFQARLRPSSAGIRPNVEEEPRHRRPAAEEIGQLRESRFVSGLRDNFRLRLESIMSRTAARLVPETRGRPITTLERTPPPLPPPLPRPAPTPSSPRTSGAPRTLPGTSAAPFGRPPWQEGLPQRAGRPAGTSALSRRPELGRAAAEPGMARLGGGGMAGSRSEWREGGAAGETRRRQPTVDNIELQELLSRRSVSTMLASEFRDRLDELIQSFITRRGVRPLVQAPWQPPPIPSQPLAPSPQPPGREGPHQVPVETSRLRPANPPPPPPPLPQTPLWNFHVPAIRPIPRQHEVPQQRQQQVQGQASAATPLATGTQLRDLEERLATRINHLDAMMEQALEMMLELQRSQRQELAGALQRMYEGSGGQAVPAEAIDGSKWTLVKRGTCCICCDRDIDSLLYRCGHMCTCRQCANELLALDGKCPMCRAPIKEVVRAFTSS